MSIQSLNALLGCVSFSWPSGIPSSSLDAMTWLKMYVQMIMLAGRGIITATGIVLVEELLFRSWLPEEIAADVGYHQAIIISGLAFSLFQRYIIYYHLENISSFSVCDVIAIFFSSSSPTLAFFILLFYGE